MIRRSKERSTIITTNKPKASLPFDLSINSLSEALSIQGVFKARYKTENHFEADVWTFLQNWIRNNFPYCVPAEVLLTSHRNRPGRSEEAWREFCSDRCGPDVRVLGSQNRLDMVIKHRVGSIGIEVKCLQRRGHARKLTQGIGQAVLALANRDRTILLIHCGTVSPKQRERLRCIAKKICGNSKLNIVIVP